MADEDEIGLAQLGVSVAWGRYRASWRVDAYGKRRGGAHPYQAAGTFRQAIQRLRNLQNESLSEAREAGLR